MKKILLIGVIILVAVTLSGCKNASEKAAEQALESSTGGQVDVDIDDETVTINTNTGTFLAGQEVSLPSGFPSDVHVADGTIKFVFELVENSGYSVTLESSDSVGDLKSEYETELANDGWTVTAALIMPTGASVAAKKDDRTISVGISSDGGISTVVLTTSVIAE